MEVKELHEVKGGDSGVERKTGPFGVVISGTAWRWGAGGGREAVPEPISLPAQRLLSALIWR